MPTAGDGIPGSAGLAQAEQDVVGMEVQCQADREDGQPAQEPRISQPRGAVCAELRDETRIDVRVDRVEGEPGAHDHNRHLLARGSRAQRVDEGPVQVVALPDTQEDQGHRLACRPSHEVDAREEGGRRKLHDHPSRPVRHLRAPAALQVVPSEWRLETQQGRERGDRGREHGPHQRPVECLLATRWSLPRL